jgi:2-iminobutanoate/2-iminopropanoate deaminase
MMTHKTIKSPHAPQAIGPYSQAVVAEGSRLIFISGQIPLDPSTMTINSDDIRLQTKQVLKNLHALIREAGGSVHHVVKTTIYLKKMDDFAVVNEEYGQLFTEHLPARVCIEASRLPKDALVEIDAIAVI